VHDHRSDRVGLVRSATINPALLAIEPIYAPELLARRRVQVVLIHAHRHHIHRLSKPPVIDPWLQLRVIDSEVNVAIVRLAREAAGQAEDAEIHSASRHRIELAENVSRYVVEILLEVHAY
jgi:hypothetical protein